MRVASFEFRVTGCEFRVTGHVLREMIFKLYIRYALCPLRYPHLFRNPKSQIRNFLHSVSNPNAVCRTLTASSVYFSSMMHEILISDVLINMMLMFSAARVLNILEATPE